MPVGYRVFQDNKRCRDYKITGWNKDTFVSLADAIKFAHLWAYPLQKEDLYDKPLQTMRVGQVYDMSMCEIPLEMKIEHVEVEQTEIIKFDDL